MRVSNASLLIAVLVGLVVGMARAGAVEAVNVRTDVAAIDLTDALERQKTDTDRIQVSTAPGASNVVNAPAGSNSASTTAWLRFLPVWTVSL